MFRVNFIKFYIAFFVVVPLSLYVYLTLTGKSPNFYFLIQLVSFWIFTLIVFPGPDDYDVSVFTIRHLFLIVTGFQLVVIPLIMSLFGISMYRLHKDVSPESFREAVLLQCFGFLISGLSFRKFNNGRNPHRLLYADSKRNLTRILFLGGCIGVSCLVYLKISNSDSLNGIFSSNSNFILKFIAITFSPWLFFAFVSWNFSESKNLQVSTQNSLRSLLLGILSISPLLLLNLNRAIIIVPALIFLLIRFPPSFSLRSLLTWALMIGLVGFLSSQIGDYRAKVNVSQNHRFSLDAAGFTPNPSTPETVQLYANSSQYLGYGLQYIDRDNISWRTPIISALLPLPKMSFLSKLKLDGSTLFNYSVYEKTSIRDLYFSSIGEIFLSYGLFGIFLAFFAIGVYLKNLERKNGQFTNRFEKFFCFLPGLWLMLFPIFSISVVSQIFFYQLAPVMFVLRKLRKRVNS